METKTVKKQTQTEKKRKKWHFFFANILRAILEPKGFKIETEIEIGKLPLKIDIVIIKKITRRKRIKLSEIFQDLNQYNIVEYKSPDDLLDINSFDKLFAYALLYKIKYNIKQRNVINTYAFTSGSIKSISNYIKANKHTLKQLSQGIYYSDFGFNFYLINFEELNLTEETAPLKLFGKEKDIHKIIEISLSTKNKLFNELFLSAKELHPLEYE